MAYTTLPNTAAQHCKHSPKAAAQPELESTPFSIFSCEESTPSGSPVILDSLCLILVYQNFWFLLRLQARRILTIRRTLTCLQIDVLWVNPTEHVGPTFVVAGWLRVSFPPWLGQPKKSEPARCKAIRHCIIRQKFRIQFPSINPCFAIDVSTSTKKVVLDQERSAIRKIHALLAPANKSKSRVIPWSGNTYADIAVEQIQNLETSYGTDPSAIYARHVKTVRESSLWFLLTDGHLSRDTMEDSRGKL